MAKAIEKAEETMQESITRNLLKMGMLVDAIAKGTGLSIEEVQKIQVTMGL